MTMLRSIQRAVPLATLVLASAAPMVSAQWNQPAIQERELFVWTGAVDREKQIVMRGDRVYTQDIGQTEPRLDRARTMSSIPRAQGQVVVRKLDGRGDARVIQQPNAGNGYQTIIRVSDAKSGSSNYRLAAYWQGYDTPGRYDDHGRGMDNGRGHDDHDNRGRDDNDWNRGRGPNAGYGRQDVVHWSGNVDDELEITIRSGRIQYRTLRGAQPTSVRAAMGNWQAGRNDQVVVSQRQGRGSVIVLQQPNARNGFTTVLRVKDPQGGYGYYDFDIVAR